MKVKHESFENVDIYTISGNISSKHEDRLNLMLMKAVHGLHKSVMNFKGVNKINRNCLKLLNRAYCTSLRMKNPIIMTEIPETYLPYIFSCGSLSSNAVRMKHIKMDSGKERVLSRVS